MSDKNREQKQYDHRLRCLFQAADDLDLATRHGVLRFIARGCLKQAKTDVVSIDILDMDAKALQREVLWLRRRVTRLLALLHLLVVAIKVTEFSFPEVGFRMAGGQKGCSVRASAPGSARACPGSARPRAPR